MTEKIAICFGNGPSRKDVNVDKFIKSHVSKQRITVIGTNFFYKETTFVDYIVAWDKAAAIIGMKEFSYTSMIIPDPIIRSKLHSNSGLYAIYWAATNLKTKKIYLIGFDHHNEDPAGETLTDLIIKKNQYSNNKEYLSMSSNNTMNTDSSKSRGDYLRDTIKKFPEIEFTAFLPPKIVLHKESPTNLKRKTIDKKYMKKTQEVSTASPPKTNVVCDVRANFSVGLKINPVCRKTA